VTVISGRGRSFATGKLLSESHGESSSHEPAHGKSSGRRLTLLTIVMLGFAALTWGVSLFGRGTTGLSNTAGNITLIFIPAWVTLTVLTVIISMWFAKFILTAEKSRDAETVQPGSHSH